MLAVLVAAVSPSRAQPANNDVPEVEGSFHGYPVLRDLQGRKLADGEYLQWVEDGRLLIKNTYDFSADHRVEENVVFRLNPLVQEKWTWRETKAGGVEREYAVDLKSGEAWARKREQTETKEWRERLEIEPGRTFAGVGFTVALRNLRAQLLRGERIELKAVAFTAKPRTVTVTVSHTGRDRMIMAGRTVTGDCFLIQPKVPAIVKVVVAAPDTRIWLTHPAPAGFLRWEGAFAEPSDPIIRVDVVAGDPSSPAERESPSAK